ncbi:hypothetical protein V6N13_034309 [Hibiscus sabdariffa]
MCTQAHEFGPKSVEPCKPRTAGPMPSSIGPVDNRVRALEGNPNPPSHRRLYRRCSDDCTGEPRASEESPRPSLFFLLASSSQRQPPRAAKTA